MNAKNFLILLVSSTKNNALFNTVSQLGLYHPSKADETKVGWLIWNDETYLNHTDQKVIHHSMIITGWEYLLWAYSCDD